MRRTGHTTFDMKAGEIFTGLVICELILVGVYWADVLTGGRFQSIHTLFDLDGEGNIPSWFSSAQLLVVSLSFWTHWLRQPAKIRPSKTFFALAAGVALYVSMDEAGQVHEQITAWMGRRYVDWLPSYAGKHFWWVMLAVAVIVGLIQLLAADLLAIWSSYRRFLLLTLLGISVGLLGCMGVETLGYKLLDGKHNTLWYKLEVSVEEFLEMFGASIMLFATLWLNRTLAPKRVKAERNRRSTSSLTLTLSQGEREQLQFASSRIRQTKV